MPKPALRPLPPPPPTTVAPPLVSNHLEGVWENRGQNGKNKHLIFAPGGIVRFEGGLEYFNPGRWVLDEDKHELRITLPQADDEKLQIFQLYLHDGVQAFDRRRKEILYVFDDQTWSLNVAGWVYSKVDSPAPDGGSQPEPVFK